MYTYRILWIFSLFSFFLFIIITHAFVTLCYEKAEAKRTPFSFFRLQMEFNKKCQACQNEELAVTKRRRREKSQHEISGTIHYPVSLLCTDKMKSWCFGVVVVVIRDYIFSIYPSCPHPVTIIVILHLNCIYAKANE